MSCTLGRVFENYMRLKIKCITRKLFLRKAASRKRSDKPSIAFHFKIMDLAEKLFLHNQVPISDFCNIIIELLPPMQPVLVSILPHTCI